MTGDKAVELINEWLNLAKEVGDMNLNRMEYDEERYNYAMDRMDVIRKEINESVSNKVGYIYDQLEKKEQLNQQVKQLKARKSQEERKARTKRLIEIGAAVESVLNRPIEHDELPKLIDFLKTQEQRGHFFSKAMNKDSQNYNSNNDKQD